MGDERPAPTPHFKNPPVVETVLGVQFAPLKDMRITHYGLLLPFLREVFPAAERLTKVSEQSPLDPIIESFDNEVPCPRGVRWSVTEGPPFPRCWYAFEDEKYLVQLQHDRFIFNWRRPPDPSGEYPRYEPNRWRFTKLFEIFLEFADRESLGTVSANQCEVTYVNHIELLEGRNSAETMDALLTGWKLATSDGWLSGTEHGEFAASYAMPEQRGRLHVRAQRAVRRADSREIIRLSLTGRGAPTTPDTDGVRQWFDLGHDWVVRGFTSLTTPEMHRRWGRIA
ncbi:MAG: TIGR04255 family protein [Planctomycetes bacterium]|nr:TIGR04255 family protein [Planctomycetota bacterium]